MTQAEAAPRPADQQAVCDHDALASTDTTEPGAWLSSNETLTTPSARQNDETRANASRTSHSAISKMGPFALPNRPLKSERPSHNHRHAGNVEESVVAKIRDSIESKRSLLRAAKAGHQIQDCLSSYFDSLHSIRGASGGPSRLPVQVYALGIGRISESRSAQVQVALLLEMADHIVRAARQTRGEDQRPSESDGEQQDCWASASREASSVASLRPDLLAYDPLFSQTDEAVLSAFSIVALSREQASPQACFESTFPPGQCSDFTSSQMMNSRSTLIYMPHCPRLLSEKYLRIFWRSDTLLDRRVTFCWNRARRYADILSDEKLNRESPCLYRIIPHLKSTDLPSLPQPNAEALNDLAFEFAHTGREDETLKKASTSSDAKDRELLDGFERLQVTSPGVEGKDTLRCFGDAGKGQSRTVTIAEHVHDEGVKEDAFIMQKTHKKKKRAHRQALIRQGRTKVERPNILSEEFWQLPAAIEGEGDEEIL